VGLAERDGAGIKVRQALAGAKIYGCPALPAGYESLVLDELNIKSLEFVAGETGEIEVKLDTEITPELRQEGIKRELVRLINSRRKASGMSVADVIEVRYQTDSQDILSSIVRFEEELKRDVIASRLVKDDGANLEMAAVNGESVGLAVTKL
jgi:isoleucyl-tRNA synthetase